MAQDSTRQALIKRIQMYEFALTEANLFLDTHPDNQEALAYYKKYSELLQQAKAEYISRYGLLEPGVMEGDTRWRWVDDPWPWEMQKEQEEA